jgi:diaminopimelate epimerase
VSRGQPIDIIKAHAYGNDFLFVADEIAARREPRDLTREVCDRHTGIGADGLIFYRLEGDVAVMRLFNSDGSSAEVSGNGVRCLAAILTERHAVAGDIRIQTDGGLKTLTLLSSSGSRHTFRASMGQASGIAKATLDAGGETIHATTLWMGNPQCVLLEAALPDEARFARLGPSLERHPAFPNGTNVEFAVVDSPDRVRILIWERGAGPTLSSGTGSCAAAVAAAAHGGAARDVTVIAPGGEQRVEWRDDAVYLTGWAEIVLEGRWVR